MTDPKVPVECFYQLNTIYEITINPNDELQQISNVYRLEKCYNSISQLISGDIKIKLNTEISEKNVGTVKKDGKRVSIPFNRIHFHGTIMFETKKQLLYFLLIKWTGFVKHCSIAINPYRKEYWGS